MGWTFDGYFFVGHQPTRRLGQKIFKLSRVGSVVLGRVGSGKPFKIVRCYPPCGMVGTGLTRLRSRRLSSPFSRVFFLFVSDSSLTSVKGELEAMRPTSASLRWEAHRGCPVSTLCVVDNTSLMVTASTDNTLRLFTLADIQVRRTDNL